MAETTTIARPYARAAFEYAQSREGDLPRWSRMLEAAAAIVTDAEMSALLDNPQVDDDVKVGLLLDALSDHLTDGGRNLINLLAENHRLTALPEVSALFDEFRAEAEKVVHAEVISAFEVTDAQRDEIVAALKARLNCDIVLECRVDDSLLGGAIVRAGDLVIDGSAQSQLAKLGAALRQ